MNAIVKPMPGSVQRDRGGEPRSRLIVPEPHVDEETREQEIARLAFTFWQQRGCPNNSAQEDWYRAERLFEGR